ncbi:MAG: response regulator [Paracoccaceae bacterium]
MPPALIWHIDGPYLKAFAVGMIATTMMHLITARAVHRPFGLVGLLAISIAVIGSNTAYWLARGDFSGLLFSTLSIVGAIGYCLGSLIHANRLHQETAAGRAEAQAANAAKGRFLAQMSHELRTPLNAILGVGHAELRRTCDPLSRERLSVLIDAANGLSTILDDILDMSAVQEGRLPIRPTQCIPSAEITASVELFRPSIEEAGLSLTLDLSDNLPKLAHFDPQRLRQCLSNLLSNALKNTASGGIWVRAFMVAGTSPPLLQIEVSDTGPGIQPGIRSEIFDPFVGGKSRAPSPGGRGLGLSICRGLARQMGGDLTLAPIGNREWSTAEGRDWTHGACFLLTLAMPVCMAAPPTPQNTLITVTDGLLRGRRILVVDDIGTNRLVAASYLDQLGAHSIEAAGGLEALRLLTAHSLDLVLLDMNMPDMDGSETFAQIRALPSPTGRVPVVALTADAMDEHRSAYLALGLDGYLAKPLTPERLANELARVLDLTATIN